MKKLVLKSDHSVELVGLLEIIPGMARININDDGTWDYAGGTEVYWDDQKPVKREGQRVFLDEDGEEHLESEVEVIDD